VIGDLLAAQRTLSQRTFERVRRIELQLGVKPSHYEPGHSGGSGGSGPGGSVGPEPGGPEGPDQGGSERPDSGGSGRPDPDASGTGPGPSRERLGV
jgi:hypothetical protein